MDSRSTGLDHPRAVDILTTEHWSLLSSRNLGYQEMLGRATIFIGIVSAIVVALALLAQATRFGGETLMVAALLVAVALFIGAMTFVRAVAINHEDARWVHGMRLVRRAYLEIVPGLEPYLVTPGDGEADPRALAHGLEAAPAQSRVEPNDDVGRRGGVELGSGGSLASDLAALAGGRVDIVAAVEAGVSVVAAVAQVRYAARFRRRHGTGEAYATGGDSR